MALDQFVLDNFYHATSSACIVDLTPPTFSGITGCVAQPNGSILASWGAATDATTPIEFNVYVQASTATGLFASGNLALITPASSAYIFLLSDVSRLQKGVTYFVGVRAKDAIGNINANTASLSAVSTGVLDDDLATIAASLLATELLLAADHVNFQSDHADFVADDAAFDADHVNFQGDHTNFQTDHTNFGTDHTNFQTDHSNFVADDAAFDADHANFVDVYNDLVTIEADLAAEKSSCKGVFAISSANELTGELWFEFKGQAVTSLLGVASYTVYDSADVAVAGFTQSGITANGNGIFLITPISAASLEPFVNYRVKITIVYDSLTYTSHKGFTVGE